TYTVQRWEYDRTAASAGRDDAPYWPQVTLNGDTERESDRREQYTVVFAGKDNSYTVNMPQAEWEKYRTGDNVVLTVSGGTVQQIRKK
ncbi:MAG: hypothetical protein J5564_00705, partial [Clostridia bacterium]|nr:hypothetical protein [Clostridia bacterium]